MFTLYRRLNLFLVIVFLLIILLAGEKVKPVKAAEPEMLDARDVNKGLYEETVKSDKAVASEVKAGRIKGIGPFVGDSLEVQKQQAFIVAFFDGIRKIAEGIAEKKEKFTVIQKDNIITTNIHEKIGDFEVHNKTEVKIIDEETSELISDRIEVNYMAQKYIIQEFILTSPPLESVKFIKWNNPPKMISGIKIHNINWLEDNTVEVIISYSKGTKLAETKKPSSKTQSSNKSSEAKKSAPIKSSEDNENGWKNLEWGMTLKEVLRFKEILRFEDDFPTYDKCHDSYHLGDYGLFATLYFEREKFIYPNDNVSELLCNNFPVFSSGVLFYKAKFFGKIVELKNYENDTEMQDIIITQLKEKYPNGKISYYYVVDEEEGLFGKKYKYEHESKLSLLDKLIESKKIPVFEYKSDKITVFINNNFNLHFYDTKVLDELVRWDIEYKKKIKDDETSKKKQLF